MKVKMRYENISKEFIENTIDKLNSIEGAVDIPVPKDGTKYEIAYSFIGCINNIPNKVYMELCEKDAFRGDVKDLYLALTQQKDPRPDMLETNSEPFDRVNIDEENTLKPELRFEDYFNGESTDNVKKERRKRFTDDKPKETTTNTDKSGEGKDRYGFRIGTASSEVVKMIETGQFALDDIRKTFPTIDVYGIMRKVKASGYKIEKILRGDRKILTLKEKDK